MPLAVILVVEDQPLLRMAAIDMIESAGFEAVEAADANQAVGILQSRVDIRIVFTDIDMPGRSRRTSSRRRDTRLLAVHSSDHNIRAHETTAR